MKNLIFLISIFLLIACKQVPKTTGDTYFYLDQNNNSYSITKNEIQYNPMTAKNSSSGVYNGGKKATITLTKEQFIDIAQRAETLLQNKDYQADKREMQTAVLSTQRDGFIIKRVLKKSEFRNQFETLLKKLLKQE